MTYYTVTLRLEGAPAAAVAVEWTNRPAPLEDAGWEPCLRLADGSWRFSSREPAAAAAPHRRAPGPFADLAIRYRLAPAGPWSAAADPRKDIVILDAGGTDEGGAEPRPLPVAPALVLAPTLLGSGEIGSELTVDPGLWSGLPAPELTFQWRRDGVDLPGAVARAHPLVAADDGCAIACAVTAANAAGALVAAAGPIRARHVAPRLVDVLPEEVFDEGTGPQAVETAFAFAGAALVFSAEGAAIDPATGVLSLPTAAPVSGAVVTVTAANSGGAVSTALRYTVEAAPPAPLEAADVTVLRSVWRPEGQFQTFSPEAAFPGLAAATVDAIEFCVDPPEAASPVWHPVRPKAGEPGAWQLFAANHPVPAGAPDAALFEAGDPRLAGRLRFRWREAQLGEWSAESGTYLVPLPPPRPAPTLREILAPTLAEAQAAMDHPLRAYKVDATFAGNSEGQAIQNVFAHCPVPLLALEAFAGQARAFASRSGSFAGTRSGPARLLEHMKFWLTNNRAPAGRSGYQAQYEAQFVAAAAILRATPSVWDLAPASGGLTAVEKTRLDLAMKGCALGSCWVLSDRNVYATTNGAGPERSIRGYKAQRGGVPNFSLPVRLIPFVVDAYMRLDGASLQAWLAGFDRDAFAAEVAAAGQLTDLHDSYRQTWTLAVMRAAHPGAVESYGPGPDKAELHHALRDGFADGRFRGLGLTLDEGQAMFMGEFERFFSRVVRPGPSTYGANLPLPGRETGPGWATAHGLKTSSPLNGIDATQLRGVLGASGPDGLTDKTAWAGLPNPGAIGMMNELDTTDGGGGGNPPIRSCTTYAYHGAAALANLAAAAIALGALDRTDPAFAGRGGGAERMRVGVTDFEYRTLHGHREYSKGAQDHPNRDWDTAYIEGQGARFDTWRGMWRMIDAWAVS
jgi:hypothetical protein